MMKGTYIDSSSLRDNVKNEICLWAYLYGHSAYIMDVYTVAFDVHILIAT